MKRKLELRDIAGYIPYAFKVQHQIPTSITIGELRVLGITKNSIVNSEFIDAEYTVKSSDYENDKLYVIKIKDTKPILRPLSDLYKTIKHNGKEVVPIVELAKIACPCLEWELWKNIAVSSDRDDGFITAKIKWEESEYYFSYTKEDGAIKNLPQLFDYLHELKIDYRGLIDEGLAVSVYDFENEIYN